ncbi:glycoside hydrolase domain-containing protein [Bradyrhizobium sp. Y36]|uniref:glycoside hydrolase domain-containing protein n=1 Tax=Bradyrhizobium sp. Y36 TaxID=2035447 RepID=UPI0013041265|nr:glycoside hydrolase domain-containing protein [Bradyrhizobium sp. Y36]
MNTNVGIIALLFALTFSGIQSAQAQTQDANIAIVDSSDSVGPYVSRLAGRGVTVIGRYYARCPQWDADRKNRIVPEKRMIDNLSEVDAILKKRLGMLSVYQFYSQADKFDDQRANNGVTVFDDRPRNPNARTVEEFNDCVSPDQPNTIEEDARLDGYAAITQAKEIVKQPIGTAIYFGVDFDLDANRRKNVMAYFRIVSRIVTGAGYVMGVYGNGDISNLLRGENSTKEKLVEFVWLTASSAHAGSADTYNRKHWDVLQTKTDTKWSVEGKLIELDTNIQNPTSSDVGFWKSGDHVVVPHDRNLAISKSRRFVCEGSPVVFDDTGQSITKAACTTAFGIVVRTFETDSKKKLIRVDCDEDGNPDGWMKVSDLSLKRPLWIDGQAKRKSAHCVR